MEYLTIVFKKMKEKTSFRNKIEFSYHRIIITAHENYRVNDSE